MSSEWDGTDWGGTAVAVQPSFGPPPGAARIVGKAATGWEPIYDGLNVPLRELRRSPLRVMREAQALYWTNPWIGTAEDAVTRKVAGLPWHIEDQDQDTVDDQERDPRLQAIKTLLEKPQAALPEDQRQTGYETWNTMIRITSRHMGLCGVGYWFLDQMDQNGLPLAILYVNPARLFPHVSDQGRLLGYSLDPRDEQGRGGTPIERREIMPFFLTPPDFGALPRGLVERAFLKARITQLVDQHSVYVLSTGGRIAGIVSPKDGYISDPDQFDTLVRDFRSVNEAPDAAKRTTILRGPVDFQRTADGPKELGAPEIGDGNRDDILAIWQVPPSQAGVGGQTVGLNSGETRRYEYQILMQGPVHDRVDTIESTIQLRLLDRYMVTGISPQLVIEEPDFDDDSAPYELAQKAREQPLTVNDRRAILKLDPLPDYGPDGEPLGVAIILPSTSTTWGQGAEADATPENPFPNAPAPKPEPVVRVLPGSPTPQLTAGEQPAKAASLGLRRALDTRVIPAMERALRSVLRAQRTAVVAKFRARASALAKRPSGAKTLWDGPAEDQRLGKALKPHVAGIAELVTQRAGEVFQKAKADPFTEAVEQALLESVGARIAGINETTRDAVSDAIRQGFEQGMTADEIAGLLEDLPAFDDARAELVARTESGFAYNTAAVSSYREYGVERVTVIDGDGDEICASVNGTTWTLDEAYDQPLGHPNCTRDFAPVLA